LSTDRATALRPTAPGAASDRAASDHAAPPRVASPRAAPPRAAPPFRLSGRGTLILAAVLSIIVIYATDQVAPATSARQAELRIWLAARATGIVTFLLLTFQICLGLVLSHPTNKSTWKLSKRIFPWHEHLWVFVFAFLLVHIVSLVLDPYAGVGLGGAFIPGLSEYRTSPVALGTLALYAFLITAVTARYTKLLPAGAWLSIHRLALGVFVLAWLHGVLSGTDSDALRPTYVGAGLAVLAAGTYRYWASRKGRPTFETSRKEVIAR
jgi:sulfoxide reductase heme-binding subunit YedZ